MIRSKEVKARVGENGSAYEVTYETPQGEGKARFGGHRARDKATAFAVEKLQELATSQSN